MSAYDAYASVLRTPEPDRPTEAEALSDWENEEGR